MKTSENYGSRMNQLLEDSFDDIEIDGYEDYEDIQDDIESENDDLNTIYDINKMLESDSVINENEITIETNNKDWANAGLDKTYEGEYDDNKAKNLFNTAYPDLEKNQIEAIRYANYFARTGNMYAKHFIVSIINKPSYCASNNVHELAKTSFTLFFQNYVRTEVEAFYNRQVLSNVDKRERIKEGQQAAFLAIFANMKTFDETKGTISTYFKRHILGALNEWESQRRGLGSKQILAVDSTVAKTQTELLAKGIDPTPRVIALKTGLSVKQVAISQSRLLAENTAVSADSEDGSYLAGKVKQSIFDSPESAFIERESVNETIELLDILTDMEKKVVLAMLQIEQIGDDLIDTDFAKNERHETSLLKIARCLDIDSNEVKKVYTEAIQKLRAANGIKNKKDKLLTGRHMTFSKDKRDDYVDEYINDLDEIFGIDKWNSKKVYKKDVHVSDGNNNYYISLKDNNRADISDKNAWKNIAEIENFELVL